MLTGGLLPVFCLFFVAAWVVLSAWVLLDRVRFDRRSRQAGLDAARLTAGAADIPERRLRRLASGDEGPVATAAARALVQADADGRLARDASRSGTGAARRRALRILARGGSPDAVELLRAARAERSTETTAAVVGIVSELDSPAADALLLDVLVAGDHPRSRTATALEPRVVRIRARLLALADGDDPVVRYWGLTLLERVPPDEKIEAAAMHSAGDDDARVRGAAAQVLGGSTGSTGLESLRGLLHDDVFFVRAHAARAVAAQGAGRLAGEVSDLLADTSWWVRAAARESLLTLGPAGVAAAMLALDHPDRFARDGARDVIVTWDRLHCLPSDGDTPCSPLETALTEEIRRLSSELGERHPPRVPATPLHTGAAA